MQFEIRGPDKLRLLDQAGKPIVSTLLYELISNGTLSSVGVNLLLGGEMTNMAGPVPPTPARSTKRRLIPERSRP